MVVSLMSYNASKHPDALTRSTHSVSRVLNSEKIHGNSTINKWPKKSNHVDHEIVSLDVTTALECARRTDGAASIIVASNHWLERQGYPSTRGVKGTAHTLHFLDQFLNDAFLFPSSFPSSSSFMFIVKLVIGGGDASGPLFPPPILDESMFSCEIATKFAFEQSNIDTNAIGYWSLYDCFPSKLSSSLQLK
jgi:hypothetical protein